MGKYYPVSVVRGNVIVVIDAGKFSEILSKWKMPASTDDTRCLVAWIITY